jgi:hypothetical protein
LRTVITAVGASATVCALASGCHAGVGSSAPAVGREALQTDIADRLVKAGEHPQSVSCKEDLIGQAGRTARCEVVMSETNSFEPVITVTGVDGDTITYAMSPAVSKEQLEKAVTRLVGAAAHAQVASVLCASGLEGKVGVIAHCEVDSGGVKLWRTIEVSSVSGLMMNFDVVPVLTKDEVAASLLDEFERQAGTRPDSAQCSGNLEGRPGNTVDCTVVTGSESTAYTLTVTTVSDGGIKYNYTPRR